MGWFGPSGNCGCCGLNCDDCDPVTTLALYIADIDCDGTIDAPGLPLCTRNNGTYVIRTSFTEIASCKWSKSLLGEKCNGTEDNGFTTTAIQQPPAGSLNNRIEIEFLAATGGGVTVRVMITRGYYVTTPANIGTGGDQSEFVFTFEDTFATCADSIGATLPLISTVETVVNGSSTGDICNVAGALVTLG